MNQIEKNCIFHIPDKLDSKGTSGSQIRPRRMIEAFIANGYSVDVVMGYGEERKKEINQIRQKIKSGTKYDFLYAESSTMPTLLTEKNHLPKYPLLDFNFFRFCKANGIPIGLFYRDIYWKFPIYKDSVKGIKRYAAYTAYCYDLKQYEKYLDAFFVPNQRMNRYVNNKVLESISHDLPPGCSFDEETIRKKELYYQNKQNNPLPLKLFYVGGIGKQYVFDSVLKVLKDFDNIALTICCREKEWNTVYPELAPLLTERITVVHESGDELKKYYENSDICLAYFKPDEYRSMAVPIKLFEYMANTIPVLASADTAVGDYTKKNGIGWTINYDEDELRLFFQHILDHYDEIVKAHNICVRCLRENTWEKRAEEVAALLKK